VGIGGDPIPDDPNRFLKLFQMTLTGIAILLIGEIAAPAEEEPLRT